MTYEKYLDYSREELLEKVRAVMSPKRFNHVLGVLMTDAGRAIRLH